MNANVGFSCGPSSRFRLAKNVRIVPGVKEWAIYKLDAHNIIRVTPDEGRRIKAGELKAPAIQQMLDAGIYEKIAEQATETDSYSKTHEIPFRSAWLELTDACNLSCSHCYMNAERKQSGVQTNWYAILDYLAAHSCQQTIFIGGEPLCHPEFFKYVEYAKKIAPAMRLCTVTNGTLWNEHTLTRVKQLDVFLKFSLLGSTAERHDSITGVNGSFESVVKNIELANRLGIRFEIASTIVPSSHETAENMKLFVAERFGNVKHSTTHVRPQGRQTQCGNISDQCSEDQLAIHISRRFFDLANQWHTCLYGKAAFSYTGLVYPCIMSRYESIDIKSVLKRKPVNVFYRWWTLTKDKITGCRDCALRYACFDCRGFANSLTEQPCNCRLASELAKQ